MKPSRSTRQLLVVLCVFALLTGCGRASGTRPAEPGHRRVVAALYPLAFAAQRVAAEGVEVINLTPPGVEPHDIELAPADVVSVRDADLVVYLSGMQPAIDRLVLGRAKPSLDVLSIPDLRPIPAEPETGFTAARVSDPHVWLDPRRFAVVAEAIARALGEGERMARLSAELGALDQEMEQGLAHCRRREIVTTHAAFGYLTERFHLRQIAVAGWAPEGEVAPRDLERVVTEARAAGATTVFTEPLVSPAVARTLARELGAGVATLHPLESLGADEARQGEDYLSIQRANLAALRQGLECSE